MNILHVERSLESNHNYVLTRAITAFGVLPGSRNAERLGHVCELPKGADLEICGDGFSERTVRARYRDCYYFIFWRDLASALPPVESEHGASAT